MQASAQSITKYYFDFRDRADFIADEVGQNFSDIETARNEAFRAAGEMARDLMMNCRVGQSAVMLRDDNGPIFEVVATFAFRALRS